MTPNDPVSEKVIAAAFTVGNTLGCGFLEKVYENALVHELRELGISLRQQWSIPVRYKGSLVGDFVADLLVEECLLVELKAVKTLDDIHFAQCLNYLKATGLRACLLINFGSKKVEVRRLVNHFDG